MVTMNPAGTDTTTPVHISGRATGEPGEPASFECGSERQSAARRWPSARSPRASPEGLLYIVRGYEDDDPHEGHRHGGEAGQTLDIILPIWRACEGFLHPHRLAHLLGADDATVTFTARWGGLNGRRLSTWSAPNRVPFSSTYRSRQDRVGSTVVASAKEIPDRLVELVGELLAPLYEIFDFFALSENLLKEEVEKVLAQERSTI